MAKTVLIVEDERAIVEILKFNLKREGYETLEALDGELGLELARTKDPDLILLDVSSASSADRSWPPASGR